jgi:single-stranded DNA-binding protein
MNDTNYFGCIVKILETPRQKTLQKNIVTTQFRVQLPHIRNQTTTIAKLKIWGNLGRDILDYYKVNDYMIIEGYLSISKKKKSKKIEITVVKAYPFLLASNIMDQKF